MRDRRDGFAEQPYRALGCERWRRVADREIDVVVTQIDDAVVCADPHVYARMLLLQGAQARQEPQASEADARAERDRAWRAGRADRPDHVLQLLNRPIRAAKQPL